jgi:MFS family permease
MYSKKSRYALCWCSLVLALPIDNSLTVDIALSLVTAPSISEISSVSRKHGNGQYAQAYALFNIAFSGGFLIGPLWGGFVTERAGWEIMVTSMGGLAVVSIAPIVLWTGRGYTRRNASP